MSIDVSVICRTLCVMTSGSQCLPLCQCESKESCCSFAVQTLVALVNCKSVLPRKFPVFSSFSLFFFRPPEVVFISFLRRLLLLFYTPAEIVLESYLIIVFLPSKGEMSML